MLHLLKCYKGAKYIYADGWTDIKLDAYVILSCIIKLLDVVVFSELVYSLPEERLAVLDIKTCN